MALSYSVSEFLAVAKLCEKLWKDVYCVARSAPKELAGLDKDLALLNSSLMWLKDEVQDPLSLLNRSGPDRVRQVNAVRKEVADALEGLSQYAAKHRLVLDSHRRQTILKVKDRIKYAFDASAIASLRSKLPYHYGYLQLLMTSVHNSSLERIERHNLLMTANITTMMSQLDELTRTWKTPVQFTGTSPTLNATAPLESRNALSQLFLEHAEARGNWQAIGLDTWLQCGYWWLIETQSVDLRVEYAAEDQNVFVQAYTDLLKAFWIFVDILSVHPSVFSSARESQQLEIRRFSEAVKSRLDELVTAKTVLPDLLSIQRTDLTIWASTAQHSQGQTQPNLNRSNRSRLLDNGEVFFSVVCCFQQGCLVQKCVLILLHGDSQDSVSQLVLQEPSGTYLYMCEFLSQTERDPGPDFSHCKKHQHCVKIRNSIMHVSFKSAYDFANFVAHHRALIELDAQIPQRYLPIVGRFHASVELHSLVRRALDPCLWPRSPDCTETHMLFWHQFDQMALSSGEPMSFESAMNAIDSLRFQDVSSLRRVRKFKYPATKKASTHAYHKVRWMKWILTLSGESPHRSWMQSTHNDRLRGMQRALFKWLQSPGIQTFAHTALCQKQWSLVKDIYVPLFNDYCNPTSITDLNFEHIYVEQDFQPTSEMLAVENRSSYWQGHRCQVLKYCLLGFLNAWTRMMTTVFITDSLENFQKALVETSVIVPVSLRPAFQDSLPALKQLINDFSQIRSRLENDEVPVLESWFRLPIARKDWEEGRVTRAANVEDSIASLHTIVQNRSRLKLKKHDLFLIAITWLHRQLYPTKHKSSVAIAYSDFEQHQPNHLENRSAFKFRIVLEAYGVFSKLVDWEQKTQAEQVLLRAAHLLLTPGDHEHSKMHEESFIEVVGRYHQRWIDGGFDDGRPDEKSRLVGGPMVYNYLWQGSGFATATKFFTT